ncbi:hypothetical protein LCGC14_1922840 [marine sediment metagenome]|uniref:Bacteriophage Mu GpT domain-containing protein n=1 Tax=marine sediment metagenome TaxID=412755 RepID=A0A0F9GDN3_9ZZZZ
MFNVQKSNVKVDKFLTALTVRYDNSEFVGNDLFPEFKVDKESDKYRIFNKDGWFTGAPKKADGAITEEATLSYDEGTYVTYERAIKDIVTERAMQNADAPVRPKIDTTNFLTEKIVISQELDQWILASGTSGLNQSGYRSVLTATTAWVEGTAPDILGDLSTAIKQISKAIGRRPNRIYFNTEISEAGALDDKIVEILKIRTDAMVTGNGLPASLRGMRVLIVDALYNTSDPGITEAYEYIIGNNAVCAWVNPGHPLTFGRTFVSKTFLVRRWFDGDREGEFIKVNKVYSPKIMSLDSGYIFTKIVDGT